MLVAEGTKNGLGTGAAPLLVSANDWLINAILRHPEAVQQNPFPIEGGRPPRV